MTEDPELLDAVQPTELESEDKAAEGRKAAAIAAARGALRIELARSPRRRRHRRSISRLATQFP